MNDLIDRQAAIDALADYIHNVDKVMGTGKLSAHDCKDAARSVLDDLPSAQPERKMGKWIEDAKTYYEQLNERGLRVDEYTPYFIDDIACSVCLAKYSTIDNETQFFKFCPNCGARMEVEHE